jgi:uncharacterized membrane protein
MNSAKIFASIVTAIALFPAASWADNVSGNNQSATLDSTTIGTGNVSVMQTNQKIIDLQKSGYYGTNVTGNNQHVSGTTTTLGHGNVDIKEAAQTLINGQKTK